MTYRPGLKRLLVHPRTPPVTPHAKDEEWNDRTGMSGPVNGLDSSWTLISTPTVAYANGGMVLSYLGSGINPSLAGMVKAQPSTPYTVTVPVSLGTHVAYNHVSVGFYDGTKFWVAQFYQDAIVSTDEFRRTGFTTWRYATRTSRTSSGNGYIIGLRKLWMQVTNDGANLSWGWSVTGVAGTFENVVTESYATALQTPTHYFIGLDPLGASTSVATFGPVRVT